MNLFKKVATLLFITLFSFNANAAFTFGTSFNYSKINHPDYKYSNDSDQLKAILKSSSFNIGYIKEINRINIGIHTNRLLNRNIKSEVKANNKTYHNKTKVAYDALSIGYRINKIIPSLFIANTEVKKKLFYNNQFLGKQDNHVYTYGASLNYLLNKTTLLGASYIAPNEEVGLEGALSLTINFLI